MQEPTKHSSERAATSGLCIVRPTNGPQTLASTCSKSGATALKQLCTRPTAATRQAARATQRPAPLRRNEGGCDQIRWGCCLPGGKAKLGSCRLVGRHRAEQFKRLLPRVLPRSHKVPGRAAGTHRGERALPPSRWSAPVLFARRRRQAAGAAKTSP